ncbi:DUF5993 family protein [Pantoea ananatis]|uniref:DUF5993 family protein n=2 Tax=Pantoea ananas TaxID=553 RepID=UPI003D0EB614
MNYCHTNYDQGGSIMYMFLPFLISLASAVCAILKKGKITYILWWLLLLVTILSFKYHATDALNLSF